MSYLQPNKRSSRLVQAAPKTCTAATWSQQPPQLPTAPRSRRPALRVRPQCWAESPRHRPQVQRQRRLPGVNRTSDRSVENSLQWFVCSQHFVGVKLFIGTNVVLILQQPVTEGYQYSQISPSRSPSGPTYTQLSTGVRGPLPPSQAPSYHPATAPPTGKHYFSSFWFISTSLLSTNAKSQTTNLTEEWEGGQNQELSQTFRHCTNKIMSKTEFIGKIAEIAQNWFGYYIFWFNPAREFQFRTKM